jgi:hypothetical protein
MVRPLRLRNARTLDVVMAGLVPAIHVLLALVKERESWMPGTRPGMTREAYYGLI